MISIIVAIGKNNLIGKDNNLPWHYKEDLQYFKETTIGKSVLMGENTFFSILSRINKPLPKRNNIVATLDKNFMYPGVSVTYNLIEFLNLHKDDEEEIFVIGGKQIYGLALPYAKKLYITHIDKDYEGNVYFPEIDYSKYSLVSSRINNELSFNVYEKKKAE